MSTIKISESGQLASDTLELGSTSAAWAILGGVDTVKFWGFSFDAFLDKYQAAVIKHIGDPSQAPWKQSIRFTDDDLAELRTALATLDFSKNPAGTIDRLEAVEFAKMSSIVGLAGPIGCGKDTAAESLELQGYTRTAFADPLRLAACLTYSIPLRYFNDRSLKEDPLPDSALSPRRIAQLLGTEVVRESIRNDIWVSRHLLRIASAIGNQDHIYRTSGKAPNSRGGVKVVVSDVRFQNEADYVRDFGGVIFKIQRSDAMGVTASTLSHKSELGFSSGETDQQLVNAGSADHFKRLAAISISRVMDAQTMVLGNHTNAAPAHIRPVETTPKMSQSARGPVQRTQQVRRHHP